MQTKQFNYILDHKLIAQQPKKQRDHSRLLLLNRNTRQISHHHFYDLPNLIDLHEYVLVRNNTKVFPARILGKKNNSSVVEILLLKRKQILETGEVWECLSKPGLKIGQIVSFPHSQMIAQCTNIIGYTRNIQFNYSQNKLFSELIKIGHTPIPPYIKWNEDDESTLRKKYQTIYAKVIGSAAAPTAGFHFTKNLEKTLMSHGLDIFEVTLHVGLGTFLPVKTNELESHEMHSEKMILDETTAKALNECKKQGKKILAIGTTTARLLESCSDKQGLLHAQSGETSIFIYPPCKFKFVDALVTNFHLPKSTLLMMVSAFCSLPNSQEEFFNFNSSLLGKAYQVAIANQYRFYSFGDAMLIL